MYRVHYLPMAILTHGSDLTLAPTLRPLVEQAGKPLKELVGAIAEAGFGAVQLDATLPGIRPRDLDRRARCDLAALLRRRGLSAAGIDLFVPRKHLSATEHVDRAVSAIYSVIELAAELGRVPVSIAMPVDDVTDDVKHALVEAADGHGVALAVHCEDNLDALRAWVEDVDLPALGMAIDPAALLSHKLDPAKVVHDAGKHLRVARLSDLTRDADEAGRRCAVGSGDLDVEAYRIALDFASSRRGPVVLDVRHLTDAGSAARAGKKVWEGAGFKI